MGMDNKGNMGSRKVPEVRGHKLKLFPKLEGEATATPDLGCAAQLTTSHARVTACPPRHMVLGEEARPDQLWLTSQITEV